MKLVADYSIYTNFSAGQDSLEEIVKVAKQKGLKKIAITEYGYKHKYFRLLKKDLPILKRQIARLKEKYKIEILLGIEANIISRQGDIDVNKEEQQEFDFIALNYKKAVYFKNFREWMLFKMPNKLSKICPSSKKLIEVNTNAYINAINKNKINAVVNLGKNLKVDATKIFKAMKKNNVYFSFYGAFKKNYDTIIKDAIKTNVKFLLNSGAKEKSKVGECPFGYKFALKLKVPASSLVNVYQGK